jgi:hypothetical protein
MQSPTTVIKNIPPFLWTTPKKGFNTCSCWNLMLQNPSYNSYKWKCMQCIRNWKFILIYYLQLCNNQIPIRWIDKKIEINVKQGIWKFTSRCATCSFYVFDFRGKCIQGSHVRRRITWLGTAKVHIFKSLSFKLLVILSNFDLIQVLTTKLYIVIFCTFKRNMHH